MSKIHKLKLGIQIYRILTCSVKIVKEQVFISFFFFSESRPFSGRLNPEGKYLYLHIDLANWKTKDKFCVCEIIKLNIFS